MKWLGDLVLELCGTTSRRTWAATVRIDALLSKPRKERELSTLKCRQDDFYLKILTFCAKFCSNSCSLRNIAGESSWASRKRMSNQQDQHLSKCSPNRAWLCCQCEVMPQIVARGQSVDLQLESWNKNNNTSSMKLNMSQHQPICTLSNPLSAKPVDSLFYCYCKTLVNLWIFPWYFAW